MSSVIEDILGSGLRILLLGSYDDQTINILHQLRLNLNETFQRYSCTTLLLENMDVYISLDPQIGDYSLFFENVGTGGVVTIIREKTKPVEILSYKNEEDFKTNIGKDAGLIDFKNFRKVSELEKVLILNDWADVVYLIKELESTRGGELIELTYLLYNLQNRTNVDPLKYEFFYKKNIEISTMMKEIVSNNKIIPQEYELTDQLNDKVIEITKKHISRLNTLISRFNQFEQ
jgi:hypothetical protein